MVIAQARKKLHQLIDSVDNTETLSLYYQILVQISQDNRLPSYLNSNDLEELHLSYDESFDKSNLIDHNVIKQKYATWFAK